MDTKSADSLVVQVGDKAKAHQAEPTAKFEYSPSAGDYRESQAKAALALVESKTFEFQDLKLPENKNLLAALNGISKQMGDKSGEATAPLSEFATLTVGKQDGAVKMAVVTRADGSLDIAKFDDKMHLTAELLHTSLGSTTREFGANGKVTVEENMAGDYKDRLEFDANGNIVHSHSETPTDVKDDLRLAGGGGIATETLSSSDKSKAFVETVTTSKDGSSVDDVKYGDGNYTHVETDAQGQVMISERSDKAKGVVERVVRQPDGEMKQFRDFLI